MKRILVWGLSNNKAGTEAVIFNYASHIPGIAFDFLCYDEPVNYSELFKSGLNRSFVIPVKIKHPLGFKRALKAFMNKHANEYAAVWANLNDISNIDVLIEAAKHHIPRLISHAHNSNIPNNLVTKVFTKLNRKKFDNLLTDRWACSKEAGNFFYGSHPFEILPNALDTNAVAFSESKRGAMRERYGIDDRFVIGTVGRLSYQKNPRYLIELLPSILELRPNALLAFVGTGDMEGELKALVNEPGLHNKVIFMGVQDDMQGILSAFDVFGFPSLYEGLPISLLEAQFNGLPCVISAAISTTAIISNNVKRIDLKDRESWIQAIADSQRQSGYLIESRADKYDINTQTGFLSHLFDD